MRKLRVLHVIVQPVLVWDDGQELTEGPAVDAVAVPLSQLAEFAGTLPAQVAALQAQLDAAEAAEAAGAAEPAEAG